MGVMTDHQKVWIMKKADVDFQQWEMDKAGDEYEHANIKIAWDFDRTELVMKAFWNIQGKNANEEIEKIENFLLKKYNEEKEKYPLLFNYKVVNND